MSFLHSVRASAPQQAQPSTFYCQAQAVAASLHSSPVQETTMRTHSSGIVALGFVLGVSGAAFAQSAPPAWHDVTIPAGTVLPVVLDTTVGSDISRIEQPV